jgi:hypothetical protein
MALDAPLFRGLRELEISKCAMDADAVGSLCRSSAVPELEMLVLNQANPGVPGIRTLTECASLRGLKCLNLVENRLGPVAMRALARSPHLGNLRALDLRGNPLGDKGAIELAAAPWLKNVAVLDLGSCEIGDRGAEALAEALVPGILVHLNLSSLSHKPGAKLSDGMKKKLRAKFGCLFA